MEDASNTHSRTGVVTLHIGHSLAIAPTTTRCLIPMTAQTGNQDVKPGCVITADTTYLIVCVLLEVNVALPVEKFPAGFHLLGGGVEGLWGGGSSLEVGGSG